MEVRLERILNKGGTWRRYLGRNSNKRESLEAQLGAKLRQKGEPGGELGGRS